MKKTIKNIALLISVSIFYSSCESIDFGDTNSNPNGPTVAVTSQLLTEAQTSVVSVITSVKGILFTQQLTEGQYPSDSRYTGLTSDYNSWYTGPIQNLNEIIKINKDEDLKLDAEPFGDNNNQIAVAKIMRAYFLQHITDRWGALPWSEAFQGINNPQPKFDSQEEIYNYMFAEIDEALALVNTNAGPQGDLIFNGNMNRWSTFANTLKLTMALRISDANATLAKTKFEAAVASGKIVRDNADNILFTFGSDENSDNPWEDRFYSRIDYLLSVTLSESLRSNLDPRLFKFVEPSRDDTFATPLFPADADAKYIGAPNGFVNGNVQDYSLPTTVVTGSQTYRSPIFTSAQVKLSLAEAASKGWNVGSGTTASLFKEGIEDSMGFWGVAQADIDAYTAAHTSATLANIAYEKWVALYLNGPEAWAEWRRLDMPALTPSANATDPRIPVRDAYSSSVEDNNSANYAAVIASQGVDNLHTKLWWDKN
jgi:hypothetical protein